MFTFKMKISTTCLESYFMSGCYKRKSGGKWTFEEIDGEELYVLVMMQE